MREAILGVFCQAPGDDAIERSWHRRIVTRRRHRLGVQNLGADSAERTSIEGFNTAHHLVQNNAECELIRARILRLALNLFGRQIGRRAPEVAGTGALRCEARDTEVAEFYFVFRRDENVARLKVAVNDSGAMSKRESASKIGSPGAGPL